MQLCSKATRLIGILQHNLHNCSKEPKELSYKQFVLPALEYAATVWDLYQYRLCNINKKGEMIHHRTAFFVLGCPWRRAIKDSITSMLSSLGCPLLHFRMMFFWYQNFSFGFSILRKLLLDFGIHCMIYQTCFWILVLVLALVLYNTSNLMQVYVVQDTPLSFLNGRIVRCICVVTHPYAYSYTKINVSY